MRLLILILCGISSALMVVLNVFVMPQLLVYAETKIKSVASLAVSDAVERSFQLCDYDSLYDIVNDDKSGVCYIKSNALEINRISATLSTLITEELQSCSEAGVSINICSAINAGIAGIGPDISVSVQPTGTAKVEFSSDFSTGGVNQTRHKLYIDIEAEIYSALGLSSRKVIINDSVLICENIIIGTTPEYFVDVNNKDDMLNLLP